MDLADFIESHLEWVLNDWAAQVGRLGVAEPHPQPGELEDSAVRLVKQIVTDMRRPQTKGERDAKGIGDRPDHSSGVSTAARAHAEQRLKLGLSLSDMVTEYRALRASVVCHWFDASLDESEENTHQLVRFNEAVDQALTESVACYSISLQRMRDVFVGILAHDLRTPLGAISNSAQYLMRLEDLSEKPLRAAANIHRSSQRAQMIVGDLVDFTRIRLEGMLPIKLGPVRLDQVCEHALAEIGALHPAQTLQPHFHGNLAGIWDAARVEEMLVNLLENAIDHGREGGDIVLEATGLDGTVTLSVTNEGNPIPSEDLRTLFDPLKRRASSPTPRRAGAGLGLGLYIAREIATAHGGAITVTSSHVTRFTVTLPRESAPNGRPPE